MLELPPGGEALGVVGIGAGAASTGDGEGRRPGIGENGSTPVKWSCFTLGCCWGESAPGFVFPWVTGAAGAAVFASPVPPPMTARAAKMRTRRPTTPARTLTINFSLEEVGMIGIA